MAQIGMRVTGRLRGPQALAAKTLLTIARAGDKGKEKYKLALTEPMLKCLPAPSAKARGANQNAGAVLKRLAERSSGRGIQGL